MVQASRDCVVVLELELANASMVVSPAGRYRYSRSGASENGLGRGAGRLGERGSRCADQAVDRGLCFRAESSTTRVVLGAVVIRALVLLALASASCDVAAPVRAAALRDVAGFAIAGS
jgi:hypothetical protein